MMHLSREEKTTMTTLGITKAPASPRPQCFYFGYSFEAYIRVSCGRAKATQKASRDGVGERIVSKGPFRESTTTLQLTISRNSRRRCLRRPAAAANFCRADPGSVVTSRRGFPLTLSAAVNTRVKRASLVKRRFAPLLSDVCASAEATT